MTESGPPSQNPRSEQRRRQFDLRDAALTVLTICIYLAQIRPFGNQAILAGLIGLSGPTAAAVLIGFFTRRLSEAVFWALSGSMFAHVVTIESTSTYGSIKYLFPLQGGLCAALVAAFAIRRPLIGLIIGTLTGGITFGLYVREISRDSDLTIMFALAGAGLGALSALLVLTFTWVQDRSRPRVPISLWTFLLVVGAIIADWIMRFTSLA